MPSPKPKPKTAAAHHNSIIHWIHHRHDKRHHPGEDRHPEQRPLLEDDHPDSESEIEPDAAEPPQRPSLWQRAKLALSQAMGMLSNTYTKSTESSSRVLRAAASGVRRLAMKSTKAARFGISCIRNTITSNPWRAITVACGILAIISIVEGIVIYNQHHTPGTIEVCATSSCIGSAHAILESLHPAYSQIDPCDDFASFVCGGFDQKYDLSKDQAQISAQSLMFDEIRHFFRQILDQDAFAQDDDAENEILNKARRDYKACTNKQKLVAYGLKPLKGLIDEIKMLFSSTRTAIRKADSFQSSLKVDSEPAKMFTQVYLQLLRMGVEPFLSFAIEPDARNPDQQTIYIRPAQPIGHDIGEEAAFDNHKLMHEYERVVENVLTEFIELKTNSSYTLQSPLKKTFSLRDLAQGVVRLEVRCNSILPGPSDLQNLTKSYNVKTYQDFTSIMPSLRVESIIQNLAPANYTGSTVVLASPRHLEKLSEILSTISVEVLQAFFIWKIVQVHSDRVEHETLHQWKQFSKRFGMEYPFHEHDRWHDCVDSVDADLGWILEGILSQYRFPLQFKHQGSAVAEAVRKFIHSSWSTQKWMNGNEQDDIGNLTSDLHIGIGYPTDDPDVTNPISLLDHYGKVVISNDTFLENKMVSTKNKIHHQWAQLGSPAQPEAWSKPISLTTVYHDSLRNQVIVPAAFVRPSSLERSTSYLLYSTLGAAVAHEAMHTIMNNMENGRANGFTRSSWSEETQSFLHQKASCFIKQYDKFSVGGPKDKVYVKSNASVHENIADASAVRAAFNAWTISEGKSPSLSLPGLTGFTNRQLFWLSYGAQFCSKMTPEEARHQVLNGRHLPGSIRLQGIVANSREFKEAFNCPVKKPMCEPW